MSRKDRKKARRRNPAVTVPTPSTEPETPVNGSEVGSQTESRGKTFGAVAICLFVASLLSGVIAGKLMSPKYNKMEALLDYAVRSSGIMYTQWDREPADPTVPVRDLKLTGGVIEYSCGFKKELRDLVNGNEITDEDLIKRRGPPALIQPKGSTDAPRWSNLEDKASTLASQLLMAHISRYIPPFHPSDALGIATPGVPAQEVIAVLLGAGEVYSLRSAAAGMAGYWATLKPVSRKDRLWQGMKLFITALSGFGIGFYIGYEDDPPCADEAFQKQLNSPWLWQQVGARFQRVYRWHFDRDAKTQAITAITKGVPGSPTLRTFYYGVEAAPMSDAERLISTRVREQLKGNSEQTNPLEYLPVWVDVIDRIGDLWGPRFIWDSTVVRNFNRSIHEPLLWYGEHEGICKPADRFMAILIERGAPDVSDSASRKYAESLWNRPITEVDRFK